MRERNDDLCYCKPGGNSRNTLLAQSSEVIETTATTVAPLETVDEEDFNPS